MTVLQSMAAVAAVVVAGWPHIGKAISFLSEKKATGPGYQSAIESLASVRLRLLKTECLGDEQKKAVDTLTLALVSGSDK